MSTYRLKTNLKESSVQAELEKRDESVRLSLETGTGSLLTVLVDLPGGKEELCSWLKSNRKALLEERLPFVEADCCSIAETIVKYYAHLDPENEDSNMVQIMYDYRKRHSLRFALRGTDIDDIFIGLYGSAYEVSLCRATGGYDKYQVDLLGFFEEYF